MKYVTGKTVGEHLFTGDDQDYSGYTGEDALQTDLFAGALEMQSANERVMTSIGNNIQHIDTIGLTKGKGAIVKEMNAGNVESEANAAMQNATEEYAAMIQENIVTHSNEQVRQMAHHIEQVETHENLTVAGVFGRWFPGDDREADDPVYDLSGLNQVHELTTTLADGREIEYVALSLNNDSGYTVWYDWRGDLDETQWSNNYEMGSLAIQSVDGSDRTHYSKKSNFTSAWDSAVSSLDSVQSDLSGFSSDVYAQWSPGDIPTDQIIDPVTAATELNQNYDNAAGQSAHAALMGIPTTADLSANLEIESNEAEDGVWEVEADIFTDHVPRNDVTSSASISSGVLTLSTEPVTDETYTLTTTDGETVDTPASSFTDNGDGTWEVDLSSDLSTTSVETLLGEVIGYKTGATYHPSEWDAPLYIAYNYTNENGEKKGAFTQIESPTTFVKVTDADGNDVETFEPESQNIQTADVEALKKELEQVREEQKRLQEEAQEEKEDDGPLFGGLFDGGLEGGGGLLGLGLIGIVILAVVGIVTDAVPGLGNN
uniref:Envelope protein N-terminal domain-containing protein n=1 Tax=Natrinema zhouii TaxID=1710539 RepID=A0A7D6CMN3_9EURY